MQANNRIIFNTAVLYAKIIICMGISLCTVPLVLRALGQSDYGLFSLIAGIIAMLAFLNGAMSVSTQRYLSVTIGSGDKERLLQVYNIGFLLHIIIGLAVVLIIEALMPLLFSHVLTIDESQQGVAHLLLHCMVVSMFFTIVTVPLDAVLNAYENMLVFSIAGIVEAVLRLLVALSLPLFASGRLAVYGLLVALVAVVMFAAKYAYCRLRYRHLRPSAAACRNGALFGKMFGFAGWNMLSALAIVGRVQGLAVIFNHFFGTIINTAYGIANQVNGVLSYFYVTIQKSINPQLMQGEAATDSSRQLTLTFALTKYSLLTMGLVALPLMFEMPYIFRLWLGDFPAYTIDFTRIVIILSLVMQTSAGLMSVIQSSGRVMWYTICICLTLLSTLLIAYAMLFIGCSPVWALWAACATEAVAVGFRFYFAHKLKHIPILRYIRAAILPNLVLFAVVGGALWLCTSAIEPSLWRVGICLAIDVVLGLILAYAVVLNREECQYIISALRRIMHRR